VTTRISHYYTHLLEDGYAIVAVDCCGKLAFKDCPAVAEWRDELRQQARMDKIKVRTRVAPWSKRVLAVRLDWAPGDEERNIILRETGFHVCWHAPADQTIVDLPTPYCPWCGLFVGWPD